MIQPRNTTLWEIGWSESNSRQGVTRHGYPECRIMLAGKPKKDILYKHHGIPVTFSGLNCLAGAGKIDSIIVTGEYFETTFPERQ